MRNIDRIVLVLGVLPLFFLAGCESSIRPMKPLQEVEMWVPDDGGPAIQLTQPKDVPAATPALAEDDSAPRGKVDATSMPADVVPENVGTRPATQASTQAATTASTQASTMAATETASTQAATMPATQVAATRPGLPPGKMVVKVIDPNETARFVYKASYDNIWQQALQLVSRMGFSLDRKDYRLGVITTDALPSAQIVEPWKPEQSTVKNALENTINSQRRTLRLTISPVAGKPDFYQVAVQVLVERETNPGETVGGPLFVEGSGFGRNTASLKSDYAPVVDVPAKWVVLGHDPALEKKVLGMLFLRI